MAITIEQSNIYINPNTTDTDITATFDTAPDEGNTILIIVGGGNGDDVFTVPSGFTKILANQGTGGNFDSWCAMAKQAGSSEGTTYLVDTDSAGDTFWIVGMELSGAVTSSWHDEDAHNYGSTSALSSGTTGTTSQDDEIAIAVAGLWGGTTPDVTSWSNSFTQFEELWETGGWDLECAAAYKVLTSTGTVETAATFTGTASPGHNGIITIKAADIVSGGLLTHFAMMIGD